MIEVDKVRIVCIYELGAANQAAQFAKSNSLQTVMR